MILLYIFNLFNIVDLRLGNNAYFWQYAIKPSGF